MTYEQIAIDGPAVSGKSSAAKHLARRLDYLYLDSGAVYRCITLASLHGFKLSQDDLFMALDDLKIKLVQNENDLGCRVLMKGEDVSEEIRTQNVTDHILPISGDPLVRKWVTGFLHDAAKEDNVVMDGRDIGSVVFPDAEFKFYITASLEARAKRRLQDLGDHEKHISEIELVEMLRHRDEGDRSRKVGPLIQVEDAVLIDNSEMDLVETVNKMIEIIDLKKDKVLKKGESSGDC